MRTEVVRMPDSGPRRENGVSAHPDVSSGGLGSQDDTTRDRRSEHTVMEINGELVTEEVRYADLGLSEPIMKALEKKGYEQATPVQGGAIPYFMKFQDVIAKAPTGTGKTFAFGIPMVEHIDPSSDQVLGLVLAPTRELAIQIRDELRDLCAFKEGVRTVCLYGGQPIDKQITQLKKKPQIVVATPGRLMDHVKRHTVRLDQVETVVLDEADRMLDMGFIRDVTRILDLMPQRKNLGLFSATISREVMDISWVYSGIRWKSRSGQTSRTNRTSPNTAWRWTAVKKWTPWSA